METRTRLDADELTGLIAAVFAYNDQQVKQVDFDIRNGTIAGAGWQRTNAIEYPDTAT